MYCSNILNYFYISIKLDIIAQNVTLGVERTSDTKEKKTIMSMYPWLASKLQAHSDICMSLNHPMYKDKNSTLMRLYLSATYAVKTFLLSTMSVLKSPEGLGWECGIFGIALHNRALLKSDDRKGLSAPLEEGFTIQHGNNNGLDFLMPLPNFSKWGRNKLLVCITNTQVTVSIDIIQIQYILFIQIYSLSIFVFSLIPQQVDHDKKCFMNTSTIAHTKQLSTCGENADGTIIDDKTLDYFHKLQTGMGKHPLHYQFSIRHQLIFYEAIGLGPLKTMNGNGEPPFMLSEASRSCLQIYKKSKKESRQYLAVKKQNENDFQAYIKSYDEELGEQQLYLVLPNILNHCICFLSSI